MERLSYISRVLRSDRSLELHLNQSDLTSVVAMGPSARHIDADTPAEGVAVLTDGPP
jgi:hypothetical protein